jgi:hypothetical protein
LPRVESGMVSLDFLLQGGLPLDPDIVLCGSHDDISSLAHTILWHRLQAGDVCLYGTLSRTREDVVREWAMKGRNVLPFLDDGHLEVLDYLSLADEIAQTPLEKLKLLLSMTFKTLDPAHFQHVLAREYWRVQNHHPHCRFVAILDSIDHLIGLMGLEKTLTFKMMIDTLLRDTKSLGIALLCHEPVSPKDIVAVRNAASIFIELTRDQNGALKVRVTKDLHANWTSLF